MRALHQNSYGDISTFELGDLPVPTPGPSHVLIRMYAAALNPIDVKRSLYVQNEIFPVVTGYDGAGVVESVGSSVTAFAPGDRVFGCTEQTPMGPKETGTVAEFCIANELMLALIPDNITFVDAAALPVAACTAIEAFQIAGAKPGDKIFISGGAGGVGIHAIQIAKSLFGASEVATTASGPKADFVRMYGADKVVNYKTEDAGEILKDWADVVLDCTQDTDMEKRILKEGGPLVSIAAFDIPDVKCFVIQPGKDRMEKTATMLKNGTLKAVVDSVYSLDDAVKAVEHIAGGRAKGKIVVKIREE